MTDGVVGVLHNILRIIFEQSKSRIRVRPLQMLLKWIIPRQNVWFEESHGQFVIHAKYTERIHRQVHYRFTDKDFKQNAVKKHVRWIHVWHFEDNDEDRSIPRSQGNFLLSACSSWIPAGEYAIIEYISAVTQRSDTRIETESANEFAIK